jgi:hypothetical protein
MSDSHLVTLLAIYRDARADAARGDLDALRAVSFHIEGNLRSQLKSALYVRREPRRLATSLLQLNRDVFLGSGRRAAAAARYRQLSSLMETMPLSLLARSACEMARLRLVDGHLESQRFVRPVIACPPPSCLTSCIDRCRRPSQLRFWLRLERPRIPTTSVSRAQLTYFMLDYLRDYLIL